MVVQRSGNTAYLTSEAGPALDGFDMAVKFSPKELKLIKKAIGTNNLTALKPPPRTETEAKIDTCEEFGSDPYLFRDFYNTRMNNLAQAQAFSFTRRDNQPRLYLLDQAPISAMGCLSVSALTHLISPSHVQGTS